MKLKTFLEGIKLAVAHIENWEELEVTSSSDDEGHFYSKVYFEPTLGIIEDGDWIEDSCIDKDDVINAICIN